PRLGRVGVLLLDLLDRLLGEVGGLLLLLAQAGALGAGLLLPLFQRRQLLRQLLQGLARLLHPRDGSARVLLLQGLGRLGGPLRRLVLALLGGLVLRRHRQVLRRPPDRLLLLAQPPASAGERLLRVPRPH